MPTSLKYLHQFAQILAQLNVMILWIFQLFGKLNAELPLIIHWSEIWVVNFCQVAPPCMMNLMNMESTGGFRIKQSWSEPKSWKWVQVFWRCKQMIWAFRRSGLLFCRAAASLQHTVTTRLNREPDNIHILKGWDQRVLEKFYNTCMLQKKIIERCRRTVSTLSG